MLVWSAMDATSIGVSPSYVLGCLNCSSSVAWNAISRREQAGLRCVQLHLGGSRRLLGARTSSLPFYLIVFSVIRSSSGSFQHHTKATHMPKLFQMFLNVLFSLISRGECSPFIQCWPWENRMKPKETNKNQFLQSGITLNTTCIFATMWYHFEIPFFFSMQRCSWEIFQEIYTDRGMK